MKRMIIGKTTALAVMVLLILGVAATADAQRGRPMMDRQQTQDMNSQWSGRGPGMMGGQGMGMMGPGMGMMGAGEMPCPIMNQMGYGMGMGMAGPMNLPNLTGEQQSKVRAIQREMRREHMEKMMDMMDIRDDIMAEMASERPDPKKIREMQGSMSQMQGEMLESTVNNRNRIYDLLTEEQRKQIREYQKNW